MKAAQAQLFAADPFFCCTPVDRSGPAQYTVLVWAPEDPERSPRPKGGRKDKAPHRTAEATPVDVWREKLVALMADGTPRTFNRMCVELLDQEASIHHGSPVQDALWALVEEGRLAHTMRIPIYFRLSEGDCA